MHQRGNNYKITIETISQWNDGANFAINIIPYNYNIKNWSIIISRSLNTKIAWLSNAEIIETEYPNKKSNLIYNKLVPTELTNEIPKNMLFTIPFGIAGSCSYLFIENFDCEIDMINLDGTNHLPLYIELDTTKVKQTMLFYNNAKTIEINNSQMIKCEIISNTGILVKLSDNYDYINNSTGTCMKINNRDIVGIFVNNHENKKYKYGLPKRINIGSHEGDNMMFWDEFASNRPRRMDSIFTYLNGGPGDYGWRLNYNTQLYNSDILGKKAIRFIRYCLQHGMIPCFIYYNINGNEDSNESIRMNIGNPIFMKLYKMDIMALCDIINQECPSHQVNIIIEPGMIGHIMKNLIPDNFAILPEPKTILAYPVLPNFENNLSGLVMSINELFKTKCRNVKIGWQISIDAYQSINMNPKLEPKFVPGNRGLIPVTDILGLDKGRNEIMEKGQLIGGYYKSCNIDYMSDFIVIDKFGIDGQIERKLADKSKWFWNHDLWMNFIYYITVIRANIKMPVILWQMAIGHIRDSINSELGGSEKKLQDSSVSFFIGQEIIEKNIPIYQYFLKNDYKSKSIIVYSNMHCEWRPYINYLIKEEDGIEMIYFGSPNEMSTKGVGNVSDGYYFINNVQKFIK